MERLDVARRGLLDRHLVPDQIYLTKRTAALLRGELTVFGVPVKVSE
jgi:hypothetical protein